MTGPAGSAEYLRNLLVGHIPVQLACAMAGLRLADLLADGPMTVDELSAAANARPDLLRRLLRGLADIGLVTLDRDDRVSATEMGALLRSGMTGSECGTSPCTAGARPARLLGQARAPRCAPATLAFEAALGAPFFSYMRDHPEDGAAFDGGMTRLSLDIIDETLARCDFSVATRILADVGGGRGHFAAAVLEAYPQLDGAVLDLPERIDAANEYLRGRGLGERCVAIGGDFFDSSPRRLRPPHPQVDPPRLGRRVVPAAARAVSRGAARRRSAARGRAAAAQWSRGRRPAASRHPDGPVHARQLRRLSRTFAGRVRAHARRLRFRARAGHRAAFELQRPRVPPAVRGFPRFRRDERIRRAAWVFWFEAEDLEDDARGGVDGAGERPHLAGDEFLDGGDERGPDVATCRNMRDSRTRWCSPISTIVRSAGSRASSSVQTSVSGPAKYDRALVGPRPNCSLCSLTIALDTACIAIARGALLGSAHGNRLPSPSKPGRKQGGGRSRTPRRYRGNSIVPGRGHMAGPARAGPSDAWAVAHTGRLVETRSLSFDAARLASQRPRSAGPVPPITGVPAGPSSFGLGRAGVPGRTNNATRSSGSLRAGRRGDACCAAPRRRSWRAGLVSRWLEGRAHDQLQQDAGLLVSELVTNSVRHAGQPAGAPVHIKAVAVDGVVRVEVHDHGHGPVRRACPGSPTRRLRAAPGERVGRSLGCQPGPWHARVVRAPCRQLGRLVSSGRHARRIGALVVVGVLLGAASAFGSSGSDTAARSRALTAGGPLPARTEIKLRQIVRRFQTTNRTPGVLVGIWSPKGTFISATGVADLATRRPLKADMQFKIASQTKTFTANLILQLVGEGKIVPRRPHLQVDRRGAQWRPDHDP